MSHEHALLPGKAHLPASRGNTASGPRLRVPPSGRSGQSSRRTARRQWRLNHVRKKRTARSPRPQVATAAAKLDFPALVDVIRQVHEQCTAQVKRAVNVGLTLRNWVIGAYIHEYEQNGADRSQYGEALLGTLAGRLRSQGLERMDERELRRYRLFYMTSPEFKSLLPVEIWSSLSAHSTPDALDEPNRESPSPDLGTPLSTDLHLLVLQPPRRTDRH